MRVSDVMTRDVAVVSPGTSVRDAARRMDQLNVGALPVCDGRRLVGIVTDRDITVRCTAVGGPPDNTRIHEIMTGDVRWCFEDDPVEEVEHEMSTVQIRRMPVIDRRRNLIGIVALGDLATDHAPGAEETLRRISEPSEPDRAGWPPDMHSAENARRSRNRGGFATRRHESTWQGERGRTFPDRFGDGSAFATTEDYRGRGPRGYVRSDNRIREDLNEQLLEDPALDATNIEAEVRNCEITLQGTVSSRYDRRRAERIAEAISGVRHVQNNLRIQQDFTTGNATGIAGTGPGGRTPPIAM